MDELELKQMIKSISPLRQHFVGVFADDELRSFVRGRIAPYLAVLYIPQRGSTIGHYAIIISNANTRTLHYFDPASHVIHDVVYYVARSMRYRISNWSRPFQPRASCSCALYAIYFAHSFYKRGVDATAALLELLYRVDRRQGEQHVIREVATLCGRQPRADLTQCP